MKRSPTILFIDDDSDFLAAQRAFFSARGYTVLVAESTEAVQKLIADQQPDIIVLDLMMEHFDSGFRLARKIRKESRFAKTPIIMLSGVAAATGQKLEADAKALTNWSNLDAFMDKPVAARDLLKAVEARLAAEPGAPAHTE